MIVVVTGAGGYVGSHCVKQLLEAGHVVRATVRDANSEANAFLRALPGAAERLTLFSANLTTPGSFDAALQGASGVIHAAAVVQLTAPDPQRDIVDVTVNGTRNVLEGCRKASVARFVLISSIAAVQDNARPAGHVYTEADYNESATVADDAYSVSKLHSERFAAEFLASTEAPGAASAAARLTGAFINPGAIYGPVLSAAHVRSSPTIIHDLMLGKIPMAPQLGFPSVDVRDVAAAAIMALENPAMEGRHICVEGTYTVKDVAAFANQSFPQYKFPTWTLPNALMYVGALFDKRVTLAFLRANLGQYRQFSAVRLKGVTGGTPWRPRAMADTVRDTCQSFIDVGCVPRKAGATSTAAAAASS